MKNKSSDTNGKRYKNLAYASSNEPVFGSCKHPVSAGKYRAMEIGGGRVIPEINYTLPPTNLESLDSKELCNRYRSMAEACLERAAELQQEELVIELELLPPHTRSSVDGTKIVESTREAMDKYSGDVNSVLRTTIIDLREGGDSHELRAGVNLVLCKY